MQTSNFYYLILFDYYVFINEKSRIQQLWFHLFVEFI